MLRSSVFVLLVFGNLLMMKAGAFYVAAGGATNRLLEENGDGLLLEDSSGDLALE